jgi:UDP:flavonoid glycosyltransferase YjiC (YdhE family)
VRLLFSFVGGRGHFEPPAAVAAAARAAGHEVAFACPVLAEPMVAARGFPVHAVGPAGRPAERLPLAPVDEEREERLMRERFAGRARERAAAMRVLLDQLRPDALVHEESDFGSPIAAELAGVPSAAVLVLASGGFIRSDVVGEPLDALRAELGLAPDPELRAAARRLVLSPFPPGLRDPAFPLPDTACAVRLGPMPAPARGDAVYATLGTVFNLESGDLFERLIASLRGRRAIVTIGSGIDPAEFSPPAGVRVERFVEQNRVLPGCHAVISHAGSGSVLGALAHGLPSVLIPMGGDQPRNARRLAALGAARVLDAVSAMPADIGEALDEVIREPSYRAAALALREEIAAMPGPERAAELLRERLLEQRNDALA